MGDKQVTRISSAKAQIQKRATTAAKQPLPTRVPVHPLLQLQRLIGNQAVNRLIQAKLTIGEPGDKYEQEADRVAADVVSRINAPTPQQTSQGQTVQRQEMPQEDEIQTKPEISSIQRQEKQEDEKLQTKPEISTIQRQEKQEEEELQTKPMVQRQQGGDGMAATPQLEASIQQARGGGQPLKESVREPMEQAFGADFSGVRVHTDAKSDQLNQSIQAKAFTTGQDIFFRQGEYDPENRKELIAHELTHVVQQSGGAVQRMLQRAKSEGERGEKHRRVAQAQRTIALLGNNINANLNGHIFGALPIGGGAPDPANPVGLHAYLNGNIPPNIVQVGIQGSLNKVHTLTWRWNNAPNAPAKQSTMFPQWMPDTHVRTLIALDFPGNRQQQVAANQLFPQATRTYIERGRSITLNQAGNTVYPIQAKLITGEPGDMYEQQADRVAAEVVAQINTPQLQQSVGSQTVPQKSDPYPYINGAAHKREESCIGQKPIPLLLSTGQRLETPIIQRDIDENQAKQELQQKGIKVKDIAGADVVVYKDLRNAGYEANEIEAAGAGGRGADFTVTRNGKIWYVEQKGSISWTSHDNLKMNSGSHSPAKQLLDKTQKANTLESTLKQRVETGKLGFVVNNLMDKDAMLAFVIKENKKGDRKIVAKHPVTLKKVMELIKYVFKNKEELSARLEKIIYASEEEEIYKEQSGERMKEIAAIMEDTNRDIQEDANRIYEELAENNWEEILQKNELTQVLDLLEIAYTEARKMTRQKTGGAYMEGRIEDDSTDATRKMLEFDNIENIKTHHATDSDDKFEIRLQPVYRNLEPLKKLAKNAD